jgi:hypothetical protein
MNKVLLPLFLLASSLGYAQTGAPAPGGTFYGVFASGSTTTHPQPTGGAIVATQVSSSQGLWSFSETDFLLVNGQIQTSARTGLALHMRDFNDIELFGLLDGGVATNGVNAGSAFAGGGFLTGPLGKAGAWRWEAGYRILKTTTGGVEHLVEIGILRKAK